MNQVPKINALDRRFVRTHSFRHLVGEYWVAIALIVMALLSSGLNVLVHSLQTSPIDEWAYIDYTDKVLNQGYVRLNEKVSDYTVHILSCNGIIPNVTYGTCGIASADDLPYDGHSQAAPYTPTFFGITALAGAAIHALTGVERLIAWRLVDALWLAASMIVMFLAFRRWKIPDLTTLVLGTIVIVSPYTWLAHSFISTDAPALLVGATLLYLATRIRMDGWSSYWLLLAFPLAIALKVTNLAATCLVIFYFAISWLTGLRAKSARLDKKPLGRETLNLIIIPVLALLLSAIVEFFWLRFISATALQTSTNMDQGVSRELSVIELLTQASNFLGSTINANPILTTKFMVFFTPLSWLCVAGVVGAFLNIRVWGHKAEMATAILAASVLAAPILAITLQLGTGSYFPVAARYGGSLIPAFMLSTAFILRNRSALILLSVYAVASAIAGIAFSLRLN